MISPTEALQRHAQIIGIGLIGGSIGMALRQRGWHVTGSDQDASRADKAVELGAIDATGIDLGAEITFVATPVGAVAQVASECLARSSSVVTDVGSAKQAIVSSVLNTNFVGGHPMAGSEQEGVEGAQENLFEGSIWVLTPVEDTDPAAHALVRSVVGSLGAEVVELSPQRHDALVAMVSHVPHLTAACLMGLAAERAEEHRALLRLAAGGFRDMTRIAAGHPGIWPDICVENRDAIVEVLRRLEGDLADMRSLVERGDRKGLIDRLERARRARINLPSRVERTVNMVEMRVRVPDRPGVLAEVTTLASALGVDIADLEIAHSAEGDGGVLILVIEDNSIKPLSDALGARGYHASTRSLA